MNRYFYCNQKTSDNFTAVLVHVKSGYLPPVDFNTVQTEKPQAAKPAFFVDLHGGLDFCQNIGDKSLVKQIFKVWSTNGIWQLGNITLRKFAWA